MRGAALLSFCLVLGTLLLGACSRSTTADLRRDVGYTGQDLKAAVVDVRTDPELRRAGGDIEHTGQDVAVALKNGGEEAQIDAYRAQQRAIHAAAELRRAHDEGRAGKSDAHDDGSSHQPP